MIDVVCPLKGYVVPGKEGKVFGKCDGGLCAWFGDRGDCAIKIISELADDMPR
jgi:hypothetical protein